MPAINIPVSFVIPLLTNMPIKSFLFAIVNICKIGNGSIKLSTTWLKTRACIGFILSAIITKANACLL